MPARTGKNNRNNIAKNWPVLHGTEKWPQLRSCWIIWRTLRHQLQLHESSLQTQPRPTGILCGRTLNWPADNEQILFANSFCLQIVFVRFLHTVHSHQAVSAFHQKSECFHPTAVTKLGLLLHVSQSHSKPLVSVRFFPFSLNYLKLLKIAQILYFRCSLLISIYINVSFKYV